jgi:RecJ-like exonuclease
VIDDVHLLIVDVERLDDVPVLVPELRAPDVVDVGEGPGLEVVDADHAMTASQQLVAQMRPEESRTTRDEAGGHCARRISAATGRGQP